TGGRAEDELAGMEDERLVAVHLDQLGQILLGFLDVDERIARIAEDAEVAIDAHVDARRLEERFVVGLDADAPFGQQAPDRAVGEDHTRILAECTSVRQLVGFDTSGSERSPQAQAPGFATPLPYPPLP